MSTRVVNLKTDKYDIYIGRPSIWGNPFVVGKDGTREEVIEKYRQFISCSTYHQNLLSELKGKALGCYCKPLPCHGDVLVDLIEGAQTSEKTNKLA